jgi:hypothetical protein
MIAKTDAVEYTKAAPFLSCEIASLTLQVQVLQDPKSEMILGTQLIDHHGLPGCVINLKIHGELVPTYETCQTGTQR